MAILPAVMFGAAPAVAQVEYVRICDTFGAGYYYVPGTADCVKADGTKKKLNETTGLYEDSVTDVREGVAISLALPKAVVDPGKTYGVAAQVGAFGSTLALGVGVAVKPGENWTLNGAAAIGLREGNVGGNAGVNFSW